MEGLLSIGPRQEEASFRAEITVSCEPQLSQLEAMPVPGPFNPSTVEIRCFALEGPDGIHVG